MNIFNSIKYPFLTLKQTQEDFPKLPEVLRKEFIYWNNLRPGTYPGDSQFVEEQLEYIRKLVINHYDDL